MTNSESAKRVAEDNKRFDPMFYHKLGSRPKRDTGTPRGFSAMSQEKKDEIRAKAVETRRRNREKQA